MIPLRTMIGLAADDYRGRYEAREYADADGAKLLYRLLKPKEYDPQTKYPLVLFLHGAGERGDDNVRQLIHGMNDFASDEIDGQVSLFRGRTAVSPRAEVGGCELVGPSDMKCRPRRPSRCG
jgi:hypothetical protein